jgi:hypothetical protein
MVSGSSSGAGFLCGPIESGMSGALLGALDERKDLNNKQRGEGRAHVDARGTER